MADPERPMQALQGIGALTAMACIDSVSCTG
jgi:hypothetical protein